MGLDKFLISYPSEPFQQAVVWPTTYTQPQTTIQPTQHLIMPPITAAQSMQPPPLAPLLFSTSDYLTAGATLHQVFSNFTNIIIKWDYNHLLFLAYADA